METKDSKTAIIFEKCEAGNKNNYNYISRANPHQVYNVKKSDLVNFWTLYCKAVQNEDHLMICEKMTSESPVIFQGKFVLNSNIDASDLFSIEFISHMAYCIQMVTSESVKLNYLSQDANDELLCCYLCSDEYVVDGKTCIDFRFQLPFCRTDTDFQKKIMRDKLIVRLKAENVIEKIKDIVNEDFWEKSLDASYSDDLELLGSIKTIKSSVLRLNQVFREIQHLSMLEGCLLSPENINDVFWPTMHAHNEYFGENFFTNLIFDKNQTFSKLDPTNEDDRFKISMFWLPLFFSLSFSLGIKCIPLNHLIEKKNREVKKFSVNDEHTYDTDFEIIDVLLPMLSFSRYKDLTSWLEIGKCLYNVTDGKQFGERKWTEISQKNNCPYIGDLHDWYCRFGNEPFLNTKNTIGYYARLDSEKDYEEWHNSWVLKMMEPAVSTSADMDIAQVLYRAYWLDYTTTGELKKQQWYEFKNHRWNSIGEGIELRRKISGDFVKRFEKFRTQLSINISNTDSVIEKKVLEEMVKKVGALNVKLKSTSFVNSVMKAAFTVFYDSTLGIKMDSNPNLLGVPNGIIEILKDKAKFRPGKPEDYVSICTEVKYDHTLHWNHCLVREIMLWFKKTFVDEETIGYFLKFSASTLRAGNFNKLFMIFSGEGNNSKSMIKKLYECTFGNRYCWTFPVTLFTGKRSASGAATPEIAGAKNARLAFAVEPCKTDHLNSGTIKEFTGGDDMYVRGMYKDGNVMKVMFKFILLCNDIPDPQGYDKAVKKRVKILPYRSMWSSSAPVDIEQQFEERHFVDDPYFDASIPKLAVAFLWILVEKYADYVKEGLPEPRDVTEYTEKFWESVDIYTQFITSCVEKAYVGSTDIQDMHVNLPQDELYNLYKVWCSTRGNGFPPPQNTFVKEINARLAKTERGNPWRGYQISYDGRCMLNN